MGTNKILIFFEAVADLTRLVLFLKSVSIMYVKNKAGAGACRPGSATPECNERKERDWYMCHLYSNMRQRI
jgi:hypothetical protein